MDMQENIRPLSQEEFQQFAGYYMQAIPSYVGDQAEHLLEALEPLSQGEKPARAWFADPWESVLIVVPPNQKNHNIALRRWRDAEEDVSMPDTPAGRAAQEIYTLMQARRTQAMQDRREALDSGFNERIKEIARIEGMLARTSGREIQNISLCAEEPDRGLQGNKFFRAGPGFAIRRFPGDLAIANASWGKGQDRRNYESIVPERNELSLNPFSQSPLKPNGITKEEWRKFVALSALTLSEFSPFPWADRLSTLPGRVILTAVQNAIKHIKDNAGSSW